MKTNRIIAALLALLGFSGCKGPAGDDDGGEVLMYGPMRVGFVVKGTVTDADENPLENIRVVLKIRDDETDETLYGARVYRDTVYTDEKGEFRIRPRPRVVLPWSLIASDIDGAENGGDFESRSEEFYVNKNMDYEAGDLVKKVDFTLTVKPQENEDE